MYERILVPLDGSARAEIVFPYVADIASKAGSEVYLIRVTESAVPTGVENIYLEQAKEQLQRKLRDFGAREKVNVQCQVSQGSPAIEILRFATSSNADLIAMTSRGASAEGPWLLGSIAAKVLRASGRPVLLIRAPASSEALKENRLFKKIMLPLDGSKLGEAAIPYAVSLAQMLDAELVLFRAVEPPLSAYTGTHMEISYELMIEYERSLKPTVIEYLERIKSSVKDRNLNVSTVSDLGIPADQILDYAKANDISLITMSTHGRSGIGRWVFGSVTDKVLHAGDTPVLAVRP